MLSTNKSILCVMLSYHLFSFKINLFTIPYKYSIISFRSPFFSHSLSVITNTAFDKLSIFDTLFFLSLIKYSHLVPVFYNHFWIFMNVNIIQLRHGLSAMWKFICMREFTLNEGVAWVQNEFSNSNSNKFSYYTKVNAVIVLFLDQWALWYQFFILRKDYRKYM